MNGRGSGCDIALFFEIIERSFSCVECKTSQALRSEIEQTRVSAMVSEVRLYELRLRPSKKQQANSSTAGVGGGLGSGVGPGEESTEEGPWNPEGDGAGVGPTPTASR